MGKHLGMEVSFAAAEAVKLSNVDVVAAYPITPQTHIVERLSEYVASGELDAEFVPVESEHSALSLCVGSEAAGARSFTCTSSQGLALMSEIVYIVPALRLPIVMILVNRSLSGPLSIWNDHSDVMSIRDCGWIQLFVENGQEVFDHVMIAYKIAENHNVLLPVMINMDGFILSHMFEPVELMEQSDVDYYLSPYQPRFVLHPDEPLTMGAYAMPTLFTEAKKAHEEALLASYTHIMRAWEAWGAVSGRSYHPVETFCSEDAETLFITMGSLSETAGEAVRVLRGQGKKAGILKLRLWRPFPFNDFLRSIGNAQRLIVLDRALSPGGPGGPVAGEIRSALYHLENRPQIFNFIAGLGGREVTVGSFLEMFVSSLSGKAFGYRIFGARG